MNNSYIARHTTHIHSGKEVLRLRHYMAALLCAFSVSLYFYIMAWDAPVFPLALLIPLLLSPRYIHSLLRVKLNPLLIVYAAYLLWPLISCLSALSSVYESHGAFGIQHMLISLLFFYLGTIPFVIGFRMGLFEGLELEPMLLGMKLSLFVGICLVISALIYCFPDLWAMRALIKQRLPLIICYLSITVLICTPIAPRFSRLLGFSGITSIIIALSRASIFQLVISFIGLVLISRKDISVFLIPKKILLILSSIFIIIMFFAPISDGNLLGTISYRFVELSEPSKVSESDYSASVRVEIWKNLIHEMSLNPLSYLIGFGQLGPSYIGPRFKSSLGEEIASYSAHNQYLDTLVRGGIPALVSEALLMLSVIYYALFGRFRNFFQKRFAFANGIALIGALIFGMFHETLRWQLFSFLFWFFAGWLTAAISFKSELILQHKTNN